MGEWDICDILWLLVIVIIGFLLYSINISNERREFIDWQILAPETPANPLHNPLPNRDNPASPPRKPHSPRRSLRSLPPPFAHSHAPKLLAVAPANLLVLRAIGPNFCIYGGQYGEGFEQVCKYSKGYL